MATFPVVLTFMVNGRVSIPDSYDLNGMSTEVQIKVTVLGAETVEIPVASVKEGNSAHAATIGGTYANPTKVSVENSKITIKKEKRKSLRHHIKYKKIKT